MSNFTELNERLDRIESAIMRNSLAGRLDTPGLGDPSERRGLLTLLFTAPIGLLIGIGAWWALQESLALAPAAGAIIALFLALVGAGLACLLAVTMKMLTVRPLLDANQVFKPAFDDIRSAARAELIREINELQDERNQSERRRVQEQSVAAQEIDRLEDQIYGLRQKIGTLQEDIHLLELKRDEVRQKVDAESVTLSSLQAKMADVADRLRAIHQDMAPDEYGRRDIWRLIDDVVAAIKQRPPEHKDA